MKRKIISTKAAPKARRRSIELFAHDSPFRPRVVPNERGSYRRQAKHRKSHAWLDSSILAHA
jgi:stalled ribosome alternative rescue factor ArfA